MHGAWFGKWVISSRFEAHAAWPALVCSVLVGLYFFGPHPLQSAVFPGVSIGHGRTLPIPAAIEAFMLAWTVLLALPAMRVSRDLPPTILAALIGLYALTSLALLVQETVSVNAGQSVWPAYFGPWAWAPKPGSMNPLVLMGGVVAALFFAVLPLLYGDRRHPVYAMLVPSRWMLLTFGVALATWWLAHRLHTAGWGHIRGVPGALGEDFLVFPVLVVHYMVLLFTAELRYLVAVRRAGPPIVSHL
jgi:hypothetical protein